MARVILGLGLWLGYSRIRIRTMAGGILGFFRTMAGGILGLGLWLGLFYGATE